MSQPVIFSRAPLWLSLPAPLDSGRSCLGRQLVEDLDVSFGDAIDGREHT